LTLTLTLWPLSGPLIAVTVSPSVPTSVTVAANSLRGGLLGAVAPDPSRRSTA